MQIKVLGHGKMGVAIRELIAESSNLDENNENADVLLDASHPNKLEELIAYCSEHNVPAVIATTNYSETQLEAIDKLSTSVPVLMATNFSLGIAVLNKLVQIATPILKDDWDIEIIEKHHNQKIDAPSGTAKTLFDSINQDHDLNPLLIHNEKRKKNDVGILSLRGGTIAGEHSVYYCGNDEILELKHTANSRKIFASGMIKAGYFLVNQKPGKYTIDDMLFSK